MNPFIPSRLAALKRAVFADGPDNLATQIGGNHEQRAQKTNIGG
jgi:hypothetical protein